LNIQENSAKAEIKPVFTTITSNEESYLKMLFKAEEVYFSEFKKDMQLMGAQVYKSITPENVYEIKIEKISDEKASLSEAEWLSNVNEFVKEYFSLFESRKFSITNLDTLKSLTSMNVCIEKVNDSIYEISALREEVAKVKSLLDEQIADEEVNGFKLFQLRILFVNKYIMKMREAYPNLKIAIEVRQRRVVLRGTRREIADAKRSIFEILDGIVVATAPADDALIKLVQLKEVYLVNLLKSQVRPVLLFFRKTVNKFILEMKI